MALTLKELDFHRSRWFVIDANERRAGDAVYAFIPAWISFNHYYATYASSRDVAFAAWSKAHASGSTGDKAQWRFLIAQKEFTDFFDKFRAQQPGLFATAVDLPVIDMASGKPVPDGVQGIVKLSALSTEQLFAVLYQIRNNLFHGSKDPYKSQRDAFLSKLAADVMVPFVAGLLGATYGEVLNVYEDEHEAERKAVAAICSVK